MSLIEKIQETQNESSSQQRKVTKVIGFQSKKPGNLHLIGMKNKNILQDA